MLINIALGIIGTLMVIMTSIIAYFLIRLITQMDKNTEGLVRLDASFLTFQTERAIEKSKIYTLENQVIEIKAQSKMIESSLESLRASLAS